MWITQKLCCCNKINFSLKYLNDVSQISLNIIYKNINVNCNCNFKLILTKKLILFWFLTNYFCTIIKSNLLCKKLFASLLNHIYLICQIVIKPYKNNWIWIKWYGKYICKLNTWWRGCCWLGWWVWPFRSSGPWWSGGSPNGTCRSSWPGGGASWCCQPTSSAMVEWNLLEIRKMLTVLLKIFS